MRRIGVLAAVVLLGTAIVDAKAQAPFQLTGLWQGSGGNTIQLRQSGTTISWLSHAASKTLWAHDFTGTISANVISGRFQDRPGYTLHNSGTISARVIDRCHLVITGVAVDGGPTSAGGEQFTRIPCPSPTPEPVPIVSVSNGCGGAGWRLFVKAQNYLGNTSTFWNSRDGYLYDPNATSYTVDFTEACNLHDAGYAGAVVVDKLRGGIKDFRGWSRKQVDAKFLADMRLLCERQIPARAPVARRNCRARGGNVSVGAVSRYAFVRDWGDRFFDADPAAPGTQRTGPRANT
jgi:hypothetical protein